MNTTGENSPLYDDVEAIEIIRPTIDGEYLRGAGCPKRHLNFNIKNATNKKWLEKLANVESMLHTGAIVAILGNRGQGKTQMAVEIIKMFSKHLERSLYIKAVDLFINIKESYNGGEESEKQLVAQYTHKYKLLVIDALEEKAESAWEGRILSHIVDKRYDAMLDTLLVSNETVEALTRQHGASIVDRIKETGGIVKCDWGSFR